jgi:Primase C terminal 2 (PriCT-2)
MIDTALVVGDFHFFTHHDRALYIGTLKADRQRWLEKNKDKWQRIEDVQQVRTLMALSPDTETPALRIARAKTDKPMLAPVRSEIIVGTLPNAQDPQPQIHASITDGRKSARATAKAQAAITPTDASIEDQAPSTQSEHEPQTNDAPSIATEQDPGAVDLLRKLAPEGSWTVRSISSIDGGAPKLPRGLGYHVGPNNAADHENGLYGWIRAAEAAKFNCYLHVAVAKPGAAGKSKLSKEDVLGSRAVWIDIDPDPARFEGSRADILAAMRAEEPGFSCIVDSGNGYQGYKFIEPYLIGGDPAHITEFESRNLAISQSLNNRLCGSGVIADKCHTADHLMRLPGTTNFLTEKKRSHGYPQGDRPARIVDWHPDRVYKLEELPAAKEEKKKASGDHGDGQQDEGAGSITSEQLKLLLSALDPTDYRDYAKWLALMMASHHATGGQGREEFIQWSIADQPYAVDGEKIGRAWDGLQIDRADSVTIRTLYHAVKEVGRDDLVRQVRYGSDKPYILYDEIRLPEILDKVELALLAGGVPIYQTGGRIVHPLRLDAASDEDGVRRSAGALLLRSVAPLRFREYYLTHIQFGRMVTAKNGMRIEVPYAPPVSLANHYLAREDMWRVLVINGIIETPTLRADGSLVIAEGFDTASGLLVDLNGVAFPPIPDASTKGEATAALAIIKELIVGFPFVPEDKSNPKLSASRSVALSAILTALVRRTLRSAPMHGFSAPTMGTGKTLLCDVVSMIGTGRLVTAMSQGHDETEDEKRLLGVLMRGDLLLLIDNVHRPICGDTLCTIMTQQSWQGRLLGENKQIHVPTNVLILATGNNLTVAGDMTTRTLISRLDAGIEQPETRRFDVDLKVEVPRRRPEIVAAGLTVLRAFDAAGRPGLSDLEPYGRFEDWSNLVRGALVWLGEPDPCDTRSFITERDPVRADLGALVVAWHNCIGDKTGTAQDIVSKSVNNGNEALALALAAVMPRGVTTKGLSSYLSDYDGRIIDGRCIRKFQDKHTKIALFRLEAVIAPTAQDEMPF